MNSRACRAQTIKAAPPLATSIIGNRALPVAVSIGITALETPEELSQTSVPQLLRSADRGLYENKRSRRARAVVGAEARR